MDLNKILPELEAKVDEIMSDLKDFQRDTVNRIDSLYEKGQDRVLVADEVGLGKTMIAKGVLAKMAVRRCKEGDDLFKVTYICSNQIIASTNLSKLDIYETGYDNISETRLSMQHLKVKQLELGLTGNSTNGSSTKRKYVQLIPLTPATSFRTVGNLAGTVNERALMYVVLKDIDGIDVNALERLMIRTALSSWDGCKEYYDYEVKRCNEFDRSYPTDIQEEISKKDTFKKLCSFLKTKHNGDEERHMIVELRKMFAEISVDLLNPDLVIMDEFQRFQFMLEHSGGEMNILAERFLTSKSDSVEDKVRVLLLSATPYKLYSTLEEVSENARNDSYREFLSVMHFLREDDALDFDKVWEEYSESLQSIDDTQKSFKFAYEQSKKAGDKMYERMCRTERLSVMKEGDFVDDSSKDVAVSVTKDDILSYQNAMKVLNKIGLGSLLPVDYVKSCPYLFTFMQKYKLKEQLSNYFKEHKKDIDICNKANLWLKERMGYKSIPITNARYGRLQNEVLPVGNKNELLLWLPPTVPYYKPEGVFKNKENFSKMMVFSSWEMVPRMISCLLSHEVESRIAIDNSLYRPRLKKGSDTTKLLQTCFPELADAYQPQDYFKDGLMSIKEIEGIVKGKITKLPEEFVNLLPSKTNDVEKMSIAVDIAIASPASCFYRITKDVDKANELAKAFVDYLNTPEKTNIIQKATESKHNSDAHWQDVLTYCKCGNLQSVLDEYVYFLTDGKDEKLPEEVIIKALDLPTTTYTIDTFTRFSKKITDKKLNEDESESGMHSHYSTAFAKGSGDKQQDRQKALQISFNSPFWPFVLASTSIGQEGLDFHPYCRKIMHWNLPSNPVDLEQREGRINRYKCLAIRQNIALKYAEQVLKEGGDGISIWTELFKLAESERSEGQSELIPYWCLGPNQQIKIERIIANYPISIDQERYERLIKVLSLYRLTMGQARQSELLEYVFQNFEDPSILKDLYITLSPFERKKQAFNLNNKYV